MANLGSTKYRRPPYLSEAVIYASGGLGSTLDDLLRWDAALREGRLLPDGVDARMRTPLMLNDGRRLGYGLGWGLSTYRGHTVTHHAGGLPSFSTFYGRFVDDGLSVIILSNLAEFDAAGLAAAIANRALDLPAPEWQPIALSAEQLDAAAGIYTNQNGERLVALRSKSGGKLDLRGFDKGTLMPASANTFVQAESPDTSVRFEAPDSDGRFMRALVTKPFYWFILERISAPRV